MSEANGETTQQTGQTGEQGAEQTGSEQTYTKAEVDAEVNKIAAKIRAEERKKVADHYEAKAAEGKQSSDDRIADLESKYAAAEARALRADIANKHGISAEDRDLFLTGTDEDSLTAQAKRLSERETERKKQGNHVPGEGRTSNQNTGDEDRRAFVRRLTGND